jgi:hypothetical protein
MLMSYTAIERYLLIFHRIFFLQHLIVLHYIPVIFCIAYPIILYTYLIFFYPCINQFDFTLTTCGGPCYAFETTISILDEFIDLVLPVVVSTLASLALLIGVLRQKLQMQQQHMWKKNRRLVIQVLYIIILHNVAWIPIVTFLLIMLFTVPQPFLLNLAYDILPVGVYIVALACPFASLMGLPELWPQFAPRIFPLTGIHKSLRSTARLPMAQMNISSRRVLVTDGTVPPTVRPVKPVPT